MAGPNSSGMMDEVEAVFYSR